MRIAHLQATSGIAGNMLIGACLDAGLAWESLAAVLEPLAIGDWAPTREAVVRGGICGTFFDVEVDDPKYRPHTHSHAHDDAHHEHHHGPHRHYPEIVAILEAATHLSVRVKRLALDALRRIGAVESALHGIPLEELHLHEIGAMDTIIDVVGGMAALELLGVERVYADPVHVGAGHRQTAHGLVPIPAPATLGILEDFPQVADAMGFELTTPTGAAVLMALLEESGTRELPPPTYRMQATGYGAGSKDFPDRPNLLRLVLGDTVEVQGESWDREQVALITTNLDDLSPEHYPVIMEALFTQGALDVTLTPTIMKQGRPGMILDVMVQPVAVGRFTEWLFRQGITLGVRVQQVDRMALKRRMGSLPLADGSVVPCKEGLLGAEVVYRKPEFRAVAEVSERTGIPLSQLLQRTGSTSTEEVAAAESLPPWATRS